MGGHPGLDERGLPHGKRIRAGMELGPIEARDLIASGGTGDAPSTVMVVEVREPDEWRICRIDGAVLVPLGEVEERAEELIEQIEDAGGALAETPVEVYCHHGVRSMAGGIELWSVAVDPRVVRY